MKNYHPWRGLRYASIFQPLAGLILMLGVASMPVGTAAASPVEPVREAGFIRLLDAVVRLDVWEAVYDGGTKRTRQGIGSGVIMSDEGHILTNAHVVGKDAERIWVTLGNLERVPAQLVGWDHWTDLAVLQLNLEAMDERGLTFEFALFGNSDDLYPGQTVYAVGTPNGLSRTVTRGIISNTNRYFEGSHVGDGYETGFFNNWLQTDAAINPGNSGGPLVDERGLVVGINTRAYLGANNLGFAVPSNSAREVMTALVESGELPRAYLGIVLGPLQDLEAFYALEINNGVLVQSVDPGSPAAAAGLRAGDILLRMDGERLDGRFPEQLSGIQRAIARRPSGTPVVFDIQRDRQPLTLTLTTEPLESRVGDRYALEDWKLSVQAISRAVARENRLPSADGVLVLGMQPAFPAARAGLRPGDIILSAGGTPVDSLATLKTIYADYQENPRDLLLEVMRNHQALFLVLKP